MYRSISLLLLVVGTAGCTRSQASEVFSELVVIEGALTSRVLLTGEVVAEDAVPLIAPNVGVWPLQLRWLLDDGSSVRAGDPVVELDTAQLATNLETLRSDIEQREQTATGARARASSELATAQLAVETAEARVAKARLEADVPLEIFAAREADRRRVELAKAELELTAARARLVAAETSSVTDVALADGALETARSKVKRLEADIERLTLRAGRDGIVVLTETPWEGRPPRVGDSIWPGQTVATLPDLATLVIEGRLFDVDEGAVALGQEATVVLDAFPDRSFAARVRDLDTTAREVGRSPLRRAFRVVLALDRGDPELLRPGMSARVEVHAARHEGVRLAPRRAIRWETGGPKLTLSNGGVVEIELGPCDHHACVVVEGPQPGTRLGAAESSR